MMNVVLRYYINCEFEFCVVRYIYVILKCIVWDVKDLKKYKIVVNMNFNYFFFILWIMIW